MTTTNIAPFGIFQPVVVDFEWAVLDRSTGSLVAEGLASRNEAIALAHELFVRS